MNNDLDLDGKRVLAGLFDDKQNAEEAYRSLRDGGYAADEINVVMSPETRRKFYGDEEIVEDTGNKALEGAGAGGTIGGVLGGIGGALAALGTNLIIPGLGLVVLGPLAAGLAGFGAGGLTGGIIGALIGAGTPKDKAEVYHSGVANGKILISVHPHSNQDIINFRNTWDEYSAEQVYPDTTA